MKRALLTLAALALPVAASAQGAEAIQRAVRSITPEDIAHRIGVIAHDSMRGRNTPSRELELTAEYIARQFRRFGLKPGGDDGSFLQRYSLFEIVADLTVAVVGGAAWQSGTDVVLGSGGSSPGIVSGPIVLVTGSGASDAVSPRGAIVLYVARMSSSRRGFAPETMAALQAIREQEPAVILVVADYADQTWEFISRRQRIARVLRQPPEGTPVLLVRDGTVLELLAEHGVDLQAARSSGAEPLRSRTLNDLRVTIAVTQRVAERSAPNVVGILEGSDPTLKDEYIVFSGHMDHLGVGRPVNGDSIYNGADDDASGTVAVIEAAEAFAALDQRPKRSMIFLTVSGEEKGLWGSGYFAEHPPVPIAQIVANLNTDMIGRNWTDTVVVIGKEHSDLGETLNRVNGEHPELNMTAIDDIWPEERFYYRSDHVNFARKGVPILFFFTGTHEDYHRPGDHVEKIDAEKESRIVKLVFYLGLDIANAAAKPKWNPESYKQIVEGGAGR